MPLKKRKITQNSADGSFKYTFYGVYRILLFHALVPLSCFHLVSVEDVQLLYHN